MWDVIYKDNWTRTLKFYLQWCSISNRGERGNGQRDQHAQQSPAHHDPDLLLLLWAVHLLHPPFICSLPSSCTSALPHFWCLLDKKKKKYSVHVQCKHYMFHNMQSCFELTYRKFLLIQTFLSLGCHAKRRYLVLWDITCNVSVLVINYYVCNMTEMCSILKS